MAVVTNSTGGTVHPRLIVVRISIGISVVTSDTFLQHVKSCVIVIDNEGRGSSSVRKTLVVVSSVVIVVIFARTPLDMVYAAIVYVVVFFDRRIASDELLRSKVGIVVV